MSWLLVINYFWVDMNVSIGAFLSTKNSGLHFQKFPVANFWNFRKTGKPREVYPKFSKSSYQGISVPFDFPLRISRIFDWMVHISENKQFSDFPENSQENFCTSCLLVKRFCIFWLNGKRLMYRIEKYGNVFMYPDTTVRFVTPLLLNSIHSN